MTLGFFQRFCLAVLWFCGIVPAIYAGEASPAPAAVFSRQFGGSDGDFPIAITSDAQGFSYVAGYTYSTNFPGAPARAADRTDADIFIAKLDSAGEIVASLALGGAGFETPAAVVVDANGDIYLTGRTTSTNFPIVNAFQSTPSGETSVFVLKLSGTSFSLIYSTYLGGNGYQLASALSVTSSGQAVVAGQTSSSDFPVTPGAFQTSSPGRGGDVFITKLSQSGSGLEFSAVFGGSGLDQPMAIAVDAAGHVFIGGSTSSADFPVTPGAHQTFLTPSQYGGSDDVFVTKIAPAGNALVFSTYWGSADIDNLSAMAVDASGAVYVASVKFGLVQGSPAQPGGIRPPPSVTPLNKTAFLFRLAPAGTVVDYARQLRTTGEDSIRALRLDSHGALQVAGQLANDVFHGSISNPGSGADFSLFHNFPVCEGVLSVAMSIAPSGRLYSAGYRNRLDARLPVSLPAQYEQQRISTDATADAWPPPTSNHHAPVGDVSLLATATDRFSTEEPVYVRIDGGDLYERLRSITVRLGDQEVARLTNAPQLLTLTNLAPGAYSLVAVASNSVGLCATSCPVSFSVVAPPSNDSFYQSIPITGATYTGNGTTVGATLEPAEPLGNNQFSYYPARTVWWCWKAPASGPVSLRASSAEIMLNLSVSTGSELSQLQRVAFTSGRVGEARCAFNAIAGVTYFFSVISEYTGVFTLELAPANPPPNDAYANRILISGGDLTIHAHNVDATYEPITKDYASSPASVWWRWFAPATGAYLVSVASTNFIPTVNISTVTNFFGMPLSPSTFDREVIVHAEAGEGFDVRIAGGGGTMGAFSLSISNLTAPPNDNFAAAALISGFPETVTGSTFGASREPLEPGSSPMSTVWYRWTAPSNTTVALELDPGYDSMLSVYTGTALSNLVEVLSGMSASALAFQAQGGVEYYLSVDAYYAIGGEFRLTVRPAHSAPNDNFSAAIPITGAEVSVLGSNLEATREPLEPAHAQYDSGEESVWWRWTAPADGEYMLSVEQAALSLIVAAYTGATLPDLVRATPQMPISLSAFATKVSATAGTEYHIAVSGRGGFGNSFRLRIRPAVPLSNDNFADRIPLFGTVAQADGSNIDAGLEPGEMIEFSQSGGSVWWSWTAPTSGQMGLWLTNASDRMQLHVFTGTTVSSLTRVAQAYSGIAGLGFNATAGQAYAILVDGSYGYRGSFSLELARLVAPANDHFTNAQPLVGISAVASSTGTGSSREFGEPAHSFSSAGSVWWTWTAPASGRTTINVSDSGFSPVAIYTGNSVNALTIVPDPTRPFGNSATFIARAGVTYRIAVYSQSVFPFQLTLSAPASPPHPRLESLRALPGGFEFSFEVVPGRTNIIEASTDLSTWVPIATNVLDCGFLLLSDSDATNFTHRFYRVRSP